MRAFEGLKFKRTESPIHNLDPRIKFVVSCIIFILAIIFKELLALGMMLIAQIPLVYLARIHREWLQSIKSGLFLTFIIFTTNFIVGYISAGYQFTNEMIIYSTAMALRFLTLMTSFSIFFLTTSPDELGLALEQSHVPYEFSFAFTTAVRFVPVLANEAQMIMDSQKARGLELEKGNFLKRIRNYIPILIPLIVGAIRRSLELAEAMETRAFGVKKQRTNLYILKLKYSDFLAIIVSFIILVVSIYIRLYIQIPEIRFPI